VDWKYAERNPMKTVSEARFSLLTPEQNPELKAKQQRLISKSYEMVEVMWETARASPELTTAVRKLEECILWHGKAMGNELKK
jgi:hypothetical protein